MRLTDKQWSIKRAMNTGALCVCPGEGHLTSTLHVNLSEVSSKFYKLLRIKYRNETRSKLAKSFSDALDKEILKTLIGDVR